MTHLITSHFLLFHLLPPFILLCPHGLMSTSPTSFLSSFSSSYLCHKFHCSHRASGLNDGPSEIKMFGSDKSRAAAVEARSNDKTLVSPRRSQLFRWHHCLVYMETNGMHLYCVNAALNYTVLWNSFKSLFSLKSASVTGSSSAFSNVTVSFKLILEHFSSPFATIQLC